MARKPKPVENAWPADRIERRAVSALVPYARNARTHSAEQVAQISASIREWGWTTPVLVDEAGMIIAGHGRVMAAQKLGISEVPVMVASGWTDAQKQAYVLADNKLALNAGWDEDLLKIELGELRDDGFDLDLIGFSEDELAKALPDTNPGKTGGMHGKVMNDDRADWSEAWALFPGDVAYIWHGGNMAHVVAESLLSVGFEIRAQIIWAKHQFVIGRGHYHPHHEPCWYAVRKSATGHWNGDRKQSTLWQIPKPQKSETGHSTQKPVECMKRPIENNSSPGQAVYEPFSGSGTTIIAAETTGRSCHAIELNPAYVDVAVTRWQNFTGQTATMEATGQTFAEVAADRQPKAKVA